jgi:hypothetical protein
MVWNEVQMKVQIDDIGPSLDLTGDTEIDNGHSFAYNVMVFFPTHY